MNGYIIIIRNIFCWFVERRFSLLRNGTTNTTQLFNVKLKIIEKLKIKNEQFSHLKSSSNK